ncbi:MAG: cell division protein FtsZ [Bryobacteraceae bacterium]
MALDALKFVIQEEVAPRTRIRVFGVGGGGSNAVARMLQEGLVGVEFCVLNTDVQALASSPAPSKLAIGSKITNGLGAGSDPSVGRQAALEDTEKIIDMLEGADMVFVTAGLGGGTGTGAAPVVASLAKELGALTVAVVTKPFACEGSKRRKQAEQGLAELGGVADTVIAIPNDRLLDQASPDTSIFDGFRLADDVLRQAVQGIADIITTPGLVNRDFSDIRSIMVGMGYAMMGTASAKGPDAAAAAAEKAIGCPLLDEGGVRGARGVLVNITGSRSLGLHEVNKACTLIRDAAQNEDVEINFGVVLNEAMGDEVKVTVIATGFERAGLPPIARRMRTTATLESVQPAARVDLPRTDPPRPEPMRVDPARAEPPRVEVVMEAPAPEPVYTEPEPVEVAPEPQHPQFEEPPIAAAAHANGPAEPLFDDLDVPPILKRHRRFVQ